MTDRQNPWALYDALIDSVPKEMLVEEILVRRHWILSRVDAPGGSGLAHVLPSPRPWQMPDPGIFTRRPAREAAALVKSWDFGTAAMGISVINAALNALRKSREESERPFWGNCFDVFRERAAGRKVAVIGHFPRLEVLSEVAKELAILERVPQDGDYPDSAAEYLLPESDMVFMTGTSAINKTLPRLLELSRGAEVHLVGPSVPLCLELFGFGADSLSGTLVSDFSSLAKELETRSLGDPRFNRLLTRRVNYLSDSLAPPEG